MIRRALPLLVLFFAGSARPADPAAATGAFFAHLAAGRLEAAFEEAAFFFQHQQTSGEFQATLHQLGLVGCAVVNADAVTVHERTAKQTVRLRGREGGHMPLVVTLTRERGAWRIFSLRSPPNPETGLSQNYFTHLGRGMDVANALDHPIPEEAAARRMSQETMLRFHDAIQQRSFEDFYEGVARSWQRELTLGMLTRTFQGFIDQRTNLSGVRGLEAVFNEPPRIDTDGLLIIAGIYPTRPYRIEFELKYFYEVPNWRPFGVAVRMIP